MKKFLGILVLGLLFFFSEANAFTITKKTKLKSGYIVSGEIVWDKNFRYTLDPGEWVVVENYRWRVNAITGRLVGLAQLIDENTVDKYVEISSISINGKWIAYLHDWFHQAVFANPYDGCYQRPEYYLLERYKRGAAFNCFKIRHYDVQKNLYASDDPFARNWSNIIRKWLRDNGYEFPKLMLVSSHLFYAPSVGGSLYGIDIVINPETHGAPKNKFTTEETSEYHRANINNYPKKKKFMEIFLSQQAYYHQEFENTVGAKSKHKLDLDQYIDENLIKKTSKKNNINLDIGDELEMLDKLYKEGVLTKEEFKKAKKKVLEQ